MGLGNNWYLFYLFGGRYYLSCGFSGDMGLGEKTGCDLLKLRLLVVKLCDGLHSQYLHPALGDSSENWFGGKHLDT